jgi:transposase
VRSNSAQERAAYVVALHTACGLNARVTAEHLGVSRERVRQLLNKARAFGMDVLAKEPKAKPRVLTPQERRQKKREEAHLEYVRLAEAVGYNPSDTDLQRRMGRRALSGRILRYFGGFRDFCRWYNITPRVGLRGFQDPEVRAKINAIRAARTTCRRGHERALHASLYGYAGKKAYYCRACYRIRKAKRKEQQQ